MIKRDGQVVFSRQQWALVALCLLAFGLRLPPLWTDRFHPDEALYASWALLIRTGRDVWLSGQAADKPPVAFYLMALSFNYVWRCEAAARLPGLLAGTLCVPLIGRIADGGFRTSRCVAAALVAFSPYMIAFSPTAFLDPLMVTFALAAWAAAGRGRAGWAGLWLGLSAATKLTGLLFLPLVGIEIAHGKYQITHRRFWTGLVGVLVLVLIWDRVKGGTPFWVQQAINYEGVRLVPSAQVLPRLWAWLSFFPCFFGWPALIALTAVALALVVIETRSRQSCSEFRTWPLLLGFSMFYLAVHCLLAFQLWDRYLLGLVPVAALLAAYVVARFVSRFISSRACRGAFHIIPSLSRDVLLLLFLLPPALTAAGSGYPIGSDHGAYDGIDRVAGYLRAQAEGTVVYDHWLGWEFRYYLWDAPVYVAHFPEPGWLRDDLRLWGKSSPRYVTVPAYVSAQPVLEAVAQAGFEAVPVLATANRRGQATFTLYELVPGK